MDIPFSSDEENEENEQKYSQLYPSPKSQKQKPKPLLHMISQKRFYPPTPPTPDMLKLQRQKMIRDEQWPCPKEAMRYIVYHWKHDIPFNKASWINYLATQSVNASDRSRLKPTKLSPCFNGLLIKKSEISADADFFHPNEDGSPETWKNYGKPSNN